MSARPRGFMDHWNPRLNTPALLDIVSRIFADYAVQLPLTLRQLFYVLVGRHGYEKTENAYSRLGKIMNKARRAEVVAMDAIRDDGFRHHQPQWIRNAEDFLDVVRTTATSLRLDRQRGRDRRLVVWCEASGMVPQPARIAEPYGIEVSSSGGLDSLTDKHCIAELWRTIR